MSEIFKYNGIKMMSKTRRIYLILALTGLILVAAGGCLISEQPGVGAKADAGYKACAPLIAALVQYYQVKNEYPTGLSELVPAFLPDLPPEIQAMGISYMRSESSYTLSFSYTGPGMNHCIYTPEKGWNCSGYY
jgi:hypothetical protein